jgi:hypothetical protein
MKKTIILFLLYFSYSFAQEGGSPYSGIALGLVDYSSTVRYLGMGGTNLAFFDENEINSFNPASWGHLKLSTISAGAFLENSLISNDNNSHSFKRLNFTQSFFGIPLDKENHLSMGLGIRPVSKINYYISRNQILNDINSDISYQGNGGLSEAVLGFSYAPVQNLNLGLKTGYYFGEIQENLLINQNSTDYYDIEIDKSIFMKGFNYTFSMTYEGLSQLLKIPTANIAFLISPATTITGRQENIQKFISSSSTVSLDTLEMFSGDVKIPTTIGLGFCMAFNKHLSFGVDYITQKWSDYEIFGNKSNQMQNSSKISIGAEYIPDKDYNSNFFQRMDLRFGLYYSTLGFKVNDKSINEYGVSFGFGLPISPISVLNAALQYGQRGMKDNGLILDKFFKVNFSLSISELWFVNPNED